VGGRVGKREGDVPAPARRTADREARGELGDAVQRQFAWVERMWEARGDLDRRVELEPGADAGADPAALQQRRGLDRARAHEDVFGPDRSALDRPVGSPLLALDPHDPTVRSTQTRDAA